MENKTLEKLINTLDFNELAELNRSIVSRIELLEMEKDSIIQKNNAKIIAELKKSSLLMSLKAKISIQVPICIGAVGDCIDIAFDTQFLEKTIRSLVVDTSKYKDFANNLEKITELISNIANKYDVSEEYIYDLLVEENIIDYVCDEYLVTE
jgi:hypothetical protein